MANDMRPDKAGFLVEKMPFAKIMYAAALPGKDYRLVRSDALLKKLYVEKGFPVVASFKYALLPEGITHEQVNDTIRMVLEKLGISKK
jgi:hypothetical protein